MCEQDFVERAVAGDRDAFAILVDRHKNLVVAVALAITRDRELACDIAQDAFVLAWRRLPMLDDRSRVGPWLAGIARNLAKSAARKQARRDARQPSSDDATPATPHDELVLHEQRALLLRTLDELPAAQREALLLYYFEDRSVEQVAVSLGITPNVAKQRLHRAREATRLRLTAHLEGTLEAMRPTAAVTTAVIAAISVGAVTNAAAATTSVGMQTTKGPAMLVSKLSIAAAVLVTGSGALFAMIRSGSDAAPSGSPHASRPVARVVSPDQHAQLTSAIAAARAQRTGAVPAALPASPAPAARVVPAPHPCSNAPDACDRDYLVQVAVTVGEVLRDSCDALREFPGAIQIRATIDSEPDAGAMFTSVEIEDGDLPDAVTSMLGTKLEHVSDYDAPNGHRPASELALKQHLEALLSAAGSNATILDVDGKQVPVERVRDLLQNAGWDDQVVTAPGVDEHAVASQELRECIVSTLYAMELDPAASPGQLTSELIVTGSRHFQRSASTP